MEERVAIIGIFIHRPEAAVKVNEILHTYADVIVGRMGIPYREKSINIISVIMNATANEISSIAGKLGRLDGITVKSMQADLQTNQ
ncbi:MAG: iron-only hydrogenase system regulator [bacterium]|nr:iron-only hydrogenase system regulator [bacterium]